MSSWGLYSSIIPIFSTYSTYRFYSNDGYRLDRSTEAKPGTNGFQNPSHATRHGLTRQVMYPVVNGGSIKGANWGYPYFLYTVISNIYIYTYMIFPTEIFPRKNGEPFNKPNLVSLFPNDQSRAETAL